MTITNENRYGPFKNDVIEIGEEEEGVHANSDISTKKIFYFRLSTVSAVAAELWLAFRWWCCFKPWPELRWRHCIAHPARTTILSTLVPTVGKHARQKPYWNYIWKQSSITPTMLLAKMNLKPRMLDSLYESLSDGHVWNYFSEDLLEINFICCYILY